MQASTRFEPAPVAALDVTSRSSFGHQFCSSGTRASSLGTLPSPMFRHTAYSNQHIDAPRMAKPTAGEENKARLFRRVARGTAHGRWIGICAAMVGARHALRPRLNKMGLTPNCRRLTNPTGLA